MLLLLLQAATGDGAGGGGEEGYGEDDDEHVYQGMDAAGVTGDDAHPDPAGDLLGDDTGAAATQHPEEQQPSQQQQQGQGLASMHVQHDKLAQPPSAQESKRKRKRRDKGKEDHKHEQGTKEAQQTPRANRPSLGVVIPANKFGVSQPQQRIRYTHNNNKHIQRVYEEHYTVNKKQRLMQNSRVPANHKRWTN